MVRSISWLLLFGIAAGGGCGDDVSPAISPMVAGDANGAPLPAIDASQKADTAVPPASMDATISVEAESPDANATPDGRASDGVSTSPDGSELDVSTRDAAGADVVNSEPAPGDANAADARASLADAASDAMLAGDGARPGWRLVWRDEFDGARGMSPDATKWTPVVSGTNSNAELEYYTARPQNLSLDGTGNLVITALREGYMGSAYTSARMDTAGKFEQAYGRFETRAKLPRGQGLWPAFWIMGNNAAAGWPARGEIDIMENFGRDPNTNIGALHGPGYSGAQDFRATYVLPGGYSTDFHVFAIEWEANVIRWYVDDNLFETRTPADLAARGGNLLWVYDHPFYVILNVAVGGRAPGNPDATTPFPQSLTVDYVRVYAR